MPNTHPQIYRIEDYLPRITAKQLINECRRNKTGPGGSLEEVILDLPMMLALAIDLILVELNYRRRKSSKTAMACRLLAMTADKIETELDNSGGAA